MKSSTRARTCGSRRRGTPCATPGTIEAACPVRRSGRTAPVHRRGTGRHLRLRGRAPGPGSRHGRERVDEAVRRRAREADHAVHRRRRQRCRREHRRAAERAPPRTTPVAPRARIGRIAPEHVVVDAVPPSPVRRLSGRAEARGGRTRARGSHAPRASDRTEARCRGSTRPGGRESRREARAELDADQAHAVAGAEPDDVVALGPRHAGLAELQRALLSSAAPAGEAATSAAVVTERSAIFIVSLLARSSRSARASPSG